MNNERLVKLAQINDEAAAQDLLRAKKREGYRTKRVAFADLARHGVPCTVAELFRDEPSPGLLDFLRNFCALNSTQPELIDELVRLFPDEKVLLIVHSIDIVGAEGRSDVGDALGSLLRMAKLWPGSVVMQWSYISVDS